MAKRKTSQLRLSPRESQFMEQLREQPELFERLQSILNIVQSQEGQIMKADEVEALVIEEVRRLGKSTMESWAHGAEEQLGRELKREDPSVTIAKKKR